MNKYTNEQIREYRQNKLNRTITRLRVKADKLTELAEQKMAEFKSHAGDHAFNFQPAKANSPFANQRRRVLDRYEKGLKLLTETDELRAKADWMEKGGVHVKGDAEIRRQAEREANDKLISVGTRVHDFCFGDGEVVKVNKKTYTIKFDYGTQFTRDKTHVEVKIL